MKKITALAALLAIPAMAAPAGYFQVPGTDTTLKLYGQIQLREAYGLNGDGMSDVSYEGMPTAADVAKGGRHNEDWQQKGQWSGNWRYYMGVTTTTPSAYGDITTTIYGRFKHSSGTANGESVKFNLEQGFVKIGGLEAGTDWSLFGYGAWEPNTLFGCVADEDGTWPSIRQIRYIGSPIHGLELGIALESDNTTAGDLKDADGGTRGNSVGTSNSTHPNISAVAAYTADWGGVTAGINHQQKKDWTKAGDDKSGNGTSYILSGGWNITSSDQVTLMLLKGGEGYGSWNDGFYADGSDYSFYKSLAISASYTHTWNDQFSSALTVSRTKWDKDFTAQTGLGYVPDDYKAMEYILNTTWQITKTVSLGAEYQHTQMKSDQQNWVDDGGGRTDTNKLDMFRFKLKATLW